MNSQSWPSAQPPAKSAGPMLRAGLTEVLVTGMLTRWISVSPNPIAKARAGGYDAKVEGFGANGYGDHSPEGYGAGAALVAEVVLTAFLVFTVLAATDRIASVAFAGIPIGLVLTLVHLVGIPITNLSVNPARSIGPALFVGGWALEQLWLFIVAPLAGALLGAVLHRALFAGGVPIEPEESAVAAETAAPTAAT